MTNDERIEKLENIVLELGRAFAEEASAAGKLPLLMDFVCQKAEKKLPVVEV
jgi:hypothetical protein